jgi:hypothetical protein
MGNTRRELVFSSTLNIVQQDLDREVAVPPCTFFPDPYRKTFGSGFPGTIFPSLFFCPQGEGVTGYRSRDWLSHARERQPSKRTEQNYLETFLICVLFMQDPRPAGKSFDRNPVLSRRGAGPACPNVISACSWHAMQTCETGSGIRNATMPGQKPCYRSGMYQDATAR